MCHLLRSWYLTNKYCSPPERAEEMETFSIILARFTGLFVDQPRQELLRSPNSAGLPCDSSKFIGEAMSSVSGEDGA